MIFGQGFLPLGLVTPVSNCKAAVLLLVHPGYYISPVPAISGEHSPIRHKERRLMYDYQLLTGMLITIYQICVETIFGDLPNDTSSLYDTCTNEKSYSNIFSFTDNHIVVLMSVTSNTQPLSAPLSLFFFCWVCYSVAISTAFRSYRIIFIIETGY